MARLTTLRPSVGVMRPSVAYMPQGEQARDRARAQDAARKLYNSGEWKRLRAEIRRRDLYTCQWPGCGRIGGALVVDHRTPHRGDRALFFDAANLWTLCKACHDGAKQRAERSAGW